MIKSIQIKNYKGFKKHLIFFKNKSVLVGKNNAGKSTLIETLRLCSLIAERYKTTQYKAVPNWIESLESGVSRHRVKGISPDVKGLIRQFKAVGHRYDTNTQTYIKLTYTNNKQIEIYVSGSEEIFAILTDEDNQIIKDKGNASRVIFPKINVLPQIGPLHEKESLLLREDYIKRSEILPITSLHFRNKIFLGKDTIAEFNHLLQKTWPGLSIQSIEKDSDNSLTLFIRENDFVAEVGSMGHGLQMWLQILWFIYKSDNASTIIIDEPDVYLHADLQKKLYNTLFSDTKQILVATHSFEFILDTSPNNILIIEKDSHRSKYSTSLIGLQHLIEDIGHSANLELVKFSSAKRCLYTEGYDPKILKIFFKKIHDVSIWDEVPVFKSGGRGGWNKVKGAAEVINRSAGGSIKLFCILDKDYFLDSENFKKIKEAKELNINLCIWNKKEIENYLINPKVLCRIINNKKTSISEEELIEIISKILEDHKVNIEDSFGTQIRNEDRSLEHSTVNQKARDLVKSNWNSFEEKINICPGKEILAKVKSCIKDTYKITVSDIRIAEEFLASEIPPDIEEFFRNFTIDS